jgi:competence protein ComEA
LKRVMELCMKTPLAVAGAAVAVAGAVAILRAPHPAPLVAGVAASDVAIAARPPAARTTTPGSLIVYVAGEVVRPGLYALSAGARVDGALRAAGGATRRADLVAVNLAEPLSDGEKVVVPARGDPAPEASGGPASMALSPAATGAGSARHSRRSRGTHRGRRHKQPPAAPIDINAADASALEELPGIGPSLAERIVAYRDLNGPFHGLDELLDVSGMTDRRLDQISPYLVIR